MNTFIFICIFIVAISTAVAAHFFNIRVIDLEKVAVNYIDELAESLADKFSIRQMGEYAKSKTEHGNTIILFRTTLKYHSGDNHITIGTGVNINIKEGYVGIVQQRKDIAKSGLTFIPFIIQPGDDKEVFLDFYLSQNPSFKESETYFSPYEVGNVIGYVTIVKAG